MREGRLGIITSIAVHSWVIPLLVASLAVENRPVRTVEVDFSLMKDQVRECAVPEADKGVLRKRSRIPGGGAASKRMEQPAPFARENPETVPVKEQIEPPPEPTIVTASDSQGETEIRGVAATYGDSSEAINSLRSHGGAAGSTHGSGEGEGPGEGRGDGQGKGRGSGEGAGVGIIEGSRDYTYIRDAIMRNIKYPDEAIRLGIEGRVVVSFVVLENGVTSRIKVVTGSGCRLLDESAKEAVATTRIHRKVPYRVVVHLPITYKLQG